MTQRITVTQKHFPDMLRRIPLRPQQLFVRGHLGPLLSKPRLAIVGSRKSTAYGKHVTRELATAATRQGVVIVSGLAFGVDSIAHRSCLDAGGHTIAVLAGGLGHITPASNTALAKEIVERGGVLMSEYQDDYQPLKYNYIARNRIVSGLSNALLITEAGIDSGTMHTAAFALEQNITVLVVPGNITSPYSAGTNHLLKSGATPVTDIDDILQALAIAGAKIQPVVPKGDSPEEDMLIRILGEGVCRNDILLDRSKLPISKYLQTLTMLEVRGLVYHPTTNTWALRQ